MYYLVGPESSLRNVILFSKRYLTSDGIPNLASLKVAYQCFLKTFQPSVTLTEQEKTEFVLDSEIEAELLGFFADDGDDGPQGESLTRERIAELKIGRCEPKLARKLDYVRGALERLSRLDPTLAGLFNLAINRVFCFEVPNHGGGSSPSAIGTIWANPKLDLTSDDLLELLIHELTHNLIHIDELARGHYRDSRLLDRPEYFALSTIRKTPRRFDLVFHSLVVGLEVLQLREMLIDHPPSPRLHPTSADLLYSCKSTLDSIKNIPGWAGLFAERGLELFQRCEKVLELFPHPADAAYF